MAGDAPFSSSVSSPASLAHAMTSSRSQTRRPPGVRRAAGNPSGARQGSRSQFDAVLGETPASYATSRGRIHLLFMVAV